MDDFKDKLAVVTGAASGIGRAIALRCAEEGMNVALADISIDKLSSLANQLRAKGVKVLAQEVDVSSTTSMQNFAKLCRAELGPVDLLFNNAGILRIGQLWEHTHAEWETMLSINVMGVVNGINAFVPEMISSGRHCHIVNTGSVGSLVAAPGMAQYTACKMAVRGITECLAHELAGEEATIDVSLLCPGPVMTSIANDIMGIESTNEEIDSSDHMMADQPGFITPEQCAACVFEAIKARKFWIFSHPFTGYYKEQTDAILSGSNPTYAEVEFD
ncbi:SDR family NAD(P)-dependent oxidoreductase [Oceanicoccus sp. KOV_DT_Chl]|uniref:SDR family NAD(P)-dependent oxidoreductase n=1 Tax=Oceanicoccus sp. KOV_DT_Chl TaxID=1904639 RepID=UPI000C7D2F0E|nr:SDR family NAD(P)-dependent oxidoreductase [Oceanicoccus sp. KOV_DT_Chl]